MPFSFPAEPSDKEAIIEEVEAIKSRLSLNDDLTDLVLSAIVRGGFAPEQQDIAKKNLKTLIPALNETIQAIILNRDVSLTKESGYHYAKKRKIGNHRRSWYFITNEKMFAHVAEEIATGVYGNRNEEVTRIKAVAIQRVIYSYFNLDPQVLTGQSIQKEWFQIPADFKIDFPGF